MLTKIKFNKISKPAGTLSSADFGLPSAHRLMPSSQPSLAKKDAHQSILNQCHGGHYKLSTLGLNLLDQG